MNYTNPDAEASLETATLALFAELGWETVDAYHEVHGTGPEATLGRENRGQVVLVPRLRAAMERLNPSLPAEALDLTVEELTRDRSAMTPVHANREIHHLLKDGVKVTIRSPEGEERVETVYVVDWDVPGNNDFLLAQQVWVTGEVYTRRADLVGFVNGLPLLFGELKAHHKRIEDAYRGNLDDYKTTIPHLFWYNAFIVLSNGSDARLGTLTAGWEHFSRWKKIGDEEEEGVISLETLVRGTCAPARFLDIVENYTLFHETQGGTAKIVAKNHQYLGVESALAAVGQVRENQGKLGVFWHTQGSGKSFSMIFFSRK
ncbi:MAG: type I restriction endonuclease subunit R, partial [Anaerolineaceae bacterium]|nr:type I restriction endonuclease subunit R [Anaerolineaceae bacterium]